MCRVRPPAVAGRFYPADPASLREQVRRHLDDAPLRTEGDVPTPLQALIAPHAGYVFSGPVAGSAYDALRRSPESPGRVVLVGPAHYVLVRGLAVPEADLFRTPFGDVPVDREGVELALSFPAVVENEEAHAPEHSLETHLPFLQEALEDFAVVPLLAGPDAGDEAEEVLEALLAEGDAFLVVSSDLSHYLTYDEARRRDARTAEAIEALASEHVGPEDACGYVGVRALLRLARNRLVARTLDLRNSGDTSGDRRRVVGYGAFAFEVARA